MDLPSWLSPKKAAQAPIGRVWHPETPPLRAPPLYVAEEIVIVGIWIRFASLWTALLLAAQFAFQLRRMRTEEAFLAATFPEYPAYQKIPRVLYRGSADTPDDGPLFCGPAEARFRVYSAAIWVTTKPVVQLSGIGPKTATSIAIGNRAEVKNQRHVGA